MVKYDENENVVVGYYIATINYLRFDSKKDMPYEMNFLLYQTY